MLLEATREHLQIREFCMYLVITIIAGFYYRMPSSPYKIRFQTAAYVRQIIGKNKRFGQEGFLKQLKNEVPGQTYSGLIKVKLLSTILQKL